MPPVVNYGRMENIFDSTGQRWVEHVWFVRDDLGTPTPADFENVSARMQIWFDHPGDISGLSREALLPTGTFLRAHKASNFFEDLVAINSPIFAAILDLEGESSDPALPANVSKQIERRGNLLGRGLYGRWHTAGLTSSDVNIFDNRRMDDDRRQAYAECYQNLQVLLEDIVPGQQAYKLVNAHSSQRADADDPQGWWSYVAEIGIRSPYFGTMQVRTPGHSKAHGHGAPAHRVGM